MRPAGATPRNSLRDTTAHTTGRTYNAMPPRLRSVEPRGHGLVSDARRRSTQPKGPFRIGNASITARTPRPPTGPTGSPAEARAFSGGRTATDGTGPGLASAYLPPPLVKGGGGAGGGSGLRPACAHAGAHRSHRTITRQDLPGRDRVYPERLQQLRARGGRLSPTTTTQADSGRVAAAEGLPTPRATETGSCGLDAVDVVAGHAP